jgi:hypothetical protein
MSRYHAMLWLAIGMVAVHATIFAALGARGDWTLAGLLVIPLPLWANSARLGIRTIEAASRLAGYRHGIDDARAALSYSNPARTLSVVGGYKAPSRGGSR